jgi:hypothetical protein
VAAYWLHYQAALLGCIVTPVLNYLVCGSGCLVVMVGWVQSGTAHSSWQVGVADGLCNNTESTDEPLS